jgi:uncharacterized membrane protein
VLRWILPVLAGFIIAMCAYQAILLATPFALMHVAMDKLGNLKPENQFFFSAMATADNQPIVRPSPDLSYSTCVFNVAKGPVLVDIASVPNHYWSVSIFDAKTDVAAVRSDRDTGGKPVKLALLKSGQKAPAGYEPLILRYDRGIALIRILLANPGEFSAIDALRRKSTCRSFRATN